MIAYLPPYANSGNRQLPAELITEGWAWYVRERLDRSAATGFTRHMVHLPFGRLRLPDGRWLMEFTGWLSCESDPAYSRVTDTFESVMGGWQAAHPGHEVIYYYGVIQNDPRLKRYADFASSATMRRVADQATKPILEVGGSLAIDVLAGIVPDTWAETVAERCIEKVEANGGKIYGEAWPHANARWAKYPTIFLEDRNDPHHPEHKSPPYVPVEQMGGELIALEGMSKATKAWARERESRGFTPCVNPLSDAWRSSK